MSLRVELEALGITLPAEFPVDELGARILDHPMSNMLAILGVSTVAFWAVEREENPKVADIWDALVYTTTCLSVGYGDIFAKTAPGKVIGSALMTIGPALSGAALDGPKKPESDPVQEEILATLKLILARLDTGATDKP